MQPRHTSRNGHGAMVLGELGTPHARVRRQGQRSIPRGIRARSLLKNPA